MRFTDPVIHACGWAIEIHRYIADALIQRPICGRLFCLIPAYPCAQAEICIHNCNSAQVRMSTSVMYLCLPTSRSKSIRKPHILLMQLLENDPDTPILRFCALPVLDPFHSPHALYVGYAYTVRVVHMQELFRGLSLWAATNAAL